MIGSQLGRTLLGRSGGSADEQQARPDDDGAYGELMAIIDRAIHAEIEGRAGRDPRRDRGGRHPAPED
jgi:hypothetical protein